MLMAVKVTARDGVERAGIEEDMMEENGIERAGTEEYRLESDGKRRNNVVQP
jgi:hypothetical protein